GRRHGRPDARHCTGPIRSRCDGGRSRAQKQRARFEVRWSRQRARLRERPDDGGARRLGAYERRRATHPRHPCDRRGTQCSALAFLVAFGLARNRHAARPHRREPTHSARAFVVAETLPNLHLASPCGVTALTWKGVAIEGTLSNGETVRAKLAVAADGRESRM